MQELSAAQEEFARASEAISITLHLVSQSIGSTFVLEEGPDQDNLLTLWFGDYAIVAENDTPDVFEVFHVERHNDEDGVEWRLLGTHDNVSKASSQIIGLIMDEACMYAFQLGANPVENDQ